MAYLNQKSLDFVRQALRRRVMRPQMGLALYPEVYGETKVQFNAFSSTTIGLKYGSEEVYISYQGKSIPEFVADINKSSIPIKAVALSRALSLSADDLILPTYTSDSNWINIPDGFEVLERLPDGGVVIRLARYSVKYDSLSKIKLAEPYSSGAGMPWWPLIDIGSFTQTLNGRKYTFSIPEYEDQVWSSTYGRPFKDVKTVPVIVKGTNVVQLPRYPIHWMNDNIVFTIGDVPLSSNVIEDVDVYNGLVYFKPGITLSENMYASYTYLETKYEYKYLNVNGHFCQNPQILDNFVVFYLLPVESTVTPKSKRTVFHSIAASLQEAIDSIEVDTIGTPVAIIGAYNIQQIIASDRASILDTRVLGGGLVGDRLESPAFNLHGISSLKDKKKKIEATYKDSASYFDIGKYDGDPYPGAAAVVIDLPDFLKHTDTVSEIKQKAHKYLAAGVYPIINFEHYSGKYIDGFTVDIGATVNTSLSGSYDSAYGIGWLNNSRSIPNGSIYTEWDTGFSFKDISVTQEEGKWIVATATGEFITQSYIKSTPDTWITFDERTLVSRGATGTQAKYTPWEEKLIVDSREAGDNGFIRKGYISFGSDYDNKQYKNIKIYSPVRIDGTGELGSEIVSELLKIHNENSRLARTSNYYEPMSENSYYSSDTGTIDNYVGSHPRMLATLELANTPGFASVCSPEAPAHMSGALDISSIYCLVNEFNTSAGGYETLPVGTTVYVPGQLKFLSEALRYAANNDYDSTYENIKDRIATIDATLIVGSDGYSYIPVDHQITDSYPYFTGIMPQTGSHSGEINYSINKEYTSTDILPDLLGVFPALRELGAETLAQFSSIPEACYNSYTTAVDNFLTHYSASPATGKKGNLVADHYFANFERLGKYAGRVAKNGIQLAEIIKSGNNLFGVQSIVGWDTGTYDYYTNQVYRILSGTIDDYKATLYRGGQFDKDISDYLYSLIWMATHTDLGVSIGAEQVALDGSKSLFKSMVSREGNIQETMYVDYEYGPGTGQVPTKALEAFALGAKYYREDYMPLLYSTFKAVTGLYSISGRYPEDALVSNGLAGKETAVERSLIEVYKLVSPNLGDVDINKINNDIRS